jgi:hypothetical protein
MCVGLLLRKKKKKKMSDLKEAARELLPKPQHGTSVEKWVIEFHENRMKLINEIDGFEMAYQLLSFEELNLWIHEWVEKLTGANEEIESFKMYRHSTNPKEKEFYEKFMRFHNRENYTDMDYIVFGQSDANGSVPADYLTNREKKVVLSAMQWLGSPVGQGYLHTCGFEPKEEE